MASRAFTPEDQLKFAAVTGDFNPLHVDPVVARRTQAGAPAVHGIHLLLWLLEVLASRYPDLPSIGEMKVRFIRTVCVGEHSEAVVTQKNESSLRAEVSADGVVAVRLNVTFGQVSPAPPLTAADLVQSPTEPVDCSMEDMAGRSGSLAFAGSPEVMERMFSRAARLLGGRRLAALGCSTRLVGMVVPGLHSLYANLRVTVCEENDPAEAIAFRVVLVDPRFRLVRMNICRRRSVRVGRSLCALSACSASPDRKRCALCFS